MFRACMRKGNAANQLEIIAKFLCYFETLG